MAYLFFFFLITNSDEIFCLLAKYGEEVEINYVTGLQADG